MLDHRFAQVVALNVAQRLTRHARQRALEDFFIEAVATRAFRKPDDINLCVGEEAIRRLAEKQQANVLWPRRFGCAADHVHLPPERLDGHRGHIVGQRTTDLAQILQDQRLGQITHFCLQREAVIERHLRRQAQQFLLGFAFRLDRAAVATDVVVPGLVLRGDRGRCRVRAMHAARRLQHDELAALHLLQGQRGKVRRLYRLAGSQKLPLHLVQLIGGQPRGRKYRLAVGVAVLSDHYVAATEIFEIVGEGAQGCE